jgi:DNA-binding CsgD family transcriptional regulator
VNAHLEQIFTKLGVTTRGAAAFYAIEQGLLSSDD